jgi:hypothetical protein
VLPFSEKETQKQPILFDVMFTARTRKKLPLSVPEHEIAANAINCELLRGQTNEQLRLQDAPESNATGFMSGPSRATHGRQRYQGMRFSLHYYFTVDYR